MGHGTIGPIRPISPMPIGWTRRRDERHRETGYEPVLLREKRSTQFRVRRNWVRVGRVEIGPTIYRTPEAPIWFENLASEDRL